MKVFVSIGDFAPLFHGPTFLFQRLKRTGVAGVELQLGFKSRWSIERYKKLSRVYDLPIVSLHQPLWSALGLWFDTGMFDYAQSLQVRHITCHPLPRTGLRSPRMQRYFQKLADLQTQTGVTVLIENLPPRYGNPLLKLLFPINGLTGDAAALHDMAAKFDLKLTLDTDHIRLANPQREPWWPKVLPRVLNVHLSSFDARHHHLPLGQGELQTAKVIADLKRRQYKGQVTLEINSPRGITMRAYDFAAITDAVALIKSA